jgi:hypothetical protein
MPSRSFRQTALLLAAGFALVGGASSLVAQLKPGVERWPIKTSVPTGTHAPKTVAYSAFAGYGEVAGVKHNDSRYQSKRIPDAIEGRHEGDIVAVKGWLHLVARENDGDYHMQISDSPTDGNNCIIVEVPNPDEKFVANDTVRAQAQVVHDFVRSKLLRDKEPSSTGNLMTHPPYVRVVGQLFYDDSHVGDQPRGKKKMKAATLWEIHPVTAMAFAPKPK